MKKQNLIASVLLSSTLFLVACNSDNAETDDNEQSENQSEQSHTENSESGSQNTTEDTTNDNQTETVDMSDFYDDTEEPEGQIRNIHKDDEDYPTRSSNSERDLEEWSTVMNKQLVDYLHRGAIGSDSPVSFEEFALNMGSYGVIVDEDSFEGYKALEDNGLSVLNHANADDTEMKFYDGDKVFVIKQTVDFLPKSEVGEYNSTDVARFTRSQYEGNYDYQTTEAVYELHINEDNNQATLKLDTPNWWE